MTDKPQGYAHLTAEISKLRRELAAQKEQFRVLEDELLVLGDERNAAQKDAERYRWLRDNRLTGRFRGLLFAQAMGWKPENMDAKQVDAAIDAAMKEC